MAWQKRPMPKGTFGFGGVLKVGERPMLGFHFADFHGDHVMLYDNKRSGERVEAHEVAAFDNSFQMPPHDIAGWLE